MILKCFIIHKKTFVYNTVKKITLIFFLTFFLFLIFKNNTSNLNFK